MDSVFGPDTVSDRGNTTGQKNFCIKNKSESKTLPVRELTFAEVTAK